jgi:hypothetical protein
MSLARILSVPVGKRSPFAAATLFAVVAVAHPARAASTFADGTVQQIEGTMMPSQVLFLSSANTTICSAAGVNGNGGYANTPWVWFQSPNLAQPRLPRELESLSLIHKSPICILRTQVTLLIDSPPMRLLMERILVARREVAP